jgi:hypothetical protein
MTKLPDTGKVIQVAYILGFVIVLVIVYKLLSAVGIIKTAKRKRSDKEQSEAIKMLRTDEYFDPTYYSGKKFKSIGGNAANLYAQNLRRAIRGIGTDEEMIYSTFGKLYNKCNVSEVASSYLLQYKRDLQADLLDDLTKKEIATLMNIINGLPNF